MKQVPFPAKDGHIEMWDGIVVGTVGNCYRVFFVDDSEISDIKHQLIQFC